MLPLLINGAPINGAEGAVLIEGHAASGVIRARSGLGFIQVDIPPVVVENPSIYAAGHNPLKAGAVAAAVLTMPHGAAGHVATASSAHQTARTTAAAGHAALRTSAASAAQVARAAGGRRLPLSGVARGIVVTAAAGHAALRYGTARAGGEHEAFAQGHAALQTAPATTGFRAYARSGLVRARSGLAKLSWELPC